MLKKLFVLPLAFLLLCGCGENKTVTPILNNISFIAQVDYGEDKFVANAIVADNALKLTVVQPEELKDLIVNITQNGVTSEFKGISYSPDINSLPQGAVVQILYNVLYDISSGKMAVRSNENCVITGRVDGYKYTFNFSPSGLPISLAIDNLDLDISFKNVTAN